MKCYFVCNGFNDLYNKSNSKYINGNSIELDLFPIKNEDKCYECNEYLFDVKDQKCKDSKNHEHIWMIEKRWFDSDEEINEYLNKRRNITNG